MTLHTGVLFRSPIPIKFKFNEYCLFQVTLEPYERDHAVVVGIYRAAPKKKE